MKKFNTNITKKTMNKSSQSDLSLEEEKEKKNKNMKQQQFSKIGLLLNKKLLLNTNIPKLKKITFKFNKEKNSFIKELPKSNYHDIFNRPYDQKLKPLRYYYKQLNNIDDREINNNSLINSLKAKTRNNSLIIPENNSYGEKSIYEVINNFENKKVFYSNRLIIDDYLSKNNKEDNFYLKRGNDNNSLISSISKLFSNKNNILPNKYKYNSMNIKNKNAKKIDNAVEVIEDSKKKFSRFYEINAQMYLKNKKISLDNDDDLF